MPKATKERKRRRKGKRKRRGRRKRRKGRKKEGMKIDKRTRKALWRLTVFSAAAQPKIRAGEQCPGRKERGSSWLPSNARPDL